MQCAGIAKLSRVFNLRIGETVSGTDCTISASRTVMRINRSCVVAKGGLSADRVLIRLNAGPVIAVQGLFQQPVAHPRASLYRGIPNGAEPPRPSRVGLRHSATAETC